jgi:hypothetical protein
MHVSVGNLPVMSQDAGFGRLARVSLDNGSMAKCAREFAGIIFSWTSWSGSETPKTSRFSIEASGASVLEPTRRGSSPFKRGIEKFVECKEFD